MIESGLKILQGFGTLKTSGGIKKQQKKLTEAKKKTATKQHEWNAQDIAESFTENYAQLMYSYAQNISAQYSMHRSANADMRTTAIASAGDVDMAGSSFMGTAGAKIDQELSDNITMMFENERRAVENLVTERNKQYYQNDNMLAGATMAYAVEDAQTNYEHEKRKQQATMDIITGSLELGNKVASAVAGAGPAGAGAPNAPGAEQSLATALKPSSGNRLTLSSRWGVK